MALAAILAGAQRTAGEAAKAELEEVAYLAAQRVMATLAAQDPTYAQQVLATLQVQNAAEMVPR